MFMPALAKAQASIRSNDQWPFDGRRSGLRPCGATGAYREFFTSVVVLDLFRGLNSYDFSRPFTSLAGVSERERASVFMSGSSLLDPRQAPPVFFVLMLCITKYFAGDRS